MARTDAEAVGLIIEVDEGVDLTPFIETATALIDAVVATAVDDNGDDYYTDPELELIERWLAAHCYTVLSPRSAAEGAGSVNATYQSRVDLGLNSSHYGQMAMRLDTAGGLAALEAETKNPGGPAGTTTKKSLAFWLGTERD